MTKNIRNILIGFGGGVAATVIFMVTGLGYRNDNDAKLADIHKLYKEATIDPARVKLEAAQAYVDTLLARARKVGQDPFVTDFMLADEELKNQTAEFNRTTELIRKARDYVDSAIHVNKK